MSDELHHGAQTVLHLSQHFVQLKKRAEELVASFEASTRGFFTPTEDEQTRHLLVSYWQSRNALFELVTSFHQVDRFELHQRPTALSVAYAGALVLVDVARFLRSSFHHRPVVRAKLNEPEPFFGIPKGTYDRVQKSLTSPVHAWHLYHASVYFKKHASRLAEVAKKDSSLQGMLGVINEYQDRMDVSADRFVLARARVQARSLRTRVSRDLLGRALYGLQKCVSSLMADRYVKAHHEPRLPDATAEEIRRLLQPGDVIVVRKEHAFTNYFLPGYWPHAALYIGSVAELQQLRLHDHENITSVWSTIQNVDDSQPARVLEAMKDGVRVRSLNNPFRSDAIAVVRPRLEETQIADAIGRGFFHVNKPYDFDFDFSRSDRLVCTEVVYRTFDGVGGLEFPLTRRAGRLTLSAEDLLQKAVDKNGFDVQAVFCPAVSDSICYKTDGDDVLRKTIGHKTV